MSSIQPALRIKDAQKKLVISSTQSALHIKDAQKKLVISSTQPALRITWEHKLVTKKCHPLDECQRDGLP